jgi:ParB/RepB/Spo0J family partition protein
MTSVKSVPKPVHFPLRLLPLDKLLPSPDNRRRPITQKSIESLARSIRQDGVLQPIVVRAHPEKEGCYEIRAGERRWHAAKAAGEKFIPAIVRKLDDQSALSVTIAENLQRENLHPLEEAETIQQAFDRGYDIKSLAARTGKTVKAIARLASLTRLSQVWKDEILRAGSEASRLSVRHLEIIARLPIETQDLLAEGSFNRVFARGFPTVEELARLIDGGLRMLASIPWKAEDETLVPEAGACLNCPKRSSKHPLLFDDGEATENGKVPKGDRCLDPACFVRKEVAHVARCECEAKAKHPSIKLVQIGYNGTSGAMQEAFGDRIVRLHSPKIVKAGTKDAVPVMQVDGPKAGAVVYIAPPKEVVAANGHVRKVRPTDAAGKPVPLPLAERRERLKKRREAFLVERVEKSLREMTIQSLARYVGQMAERHDKDAEKFDALSLVLAFGTSHRADRVHGKEAWERYEALIARKAESPVLAALFEVTRVWAARLGNPLTHTVLEQGQDARKMCRLMGISYGVFESEAITAIPTPKSWAEEMAAEATKEHAAETAAKFTKQAEKPATSPADGPVEELTGIEGDDDEECPFEANGATPNHVRQPAARVGTAPHRNGTLRKALAKGAKGKRTRTRRT